ncbi:MAG: TerB family tellurite resistance protein [Candidatus Dadabacteria bacterium]|nr:TerB family tellurite resistance protein [Candidatus Dadabacteria bacterium]
MVTQTETDKAHALNLATAALLVEISKADNRVSDSELTTIIEAMRKRFGLDELEAQALVQLAHRASDDAVSLTDFTHLLNQNLTQEDRVSIVQSLWQVANADTDIDQHEEYYVRKIADLLYVSHSDFIRTKLRVVEDKAN